MAQKKKSIKRNSATGASSQRAAARKKSGTGIGTRITCGVLAVVVLAGATLSILEWATPKDWKGRPSQWWKGEQAQPVEPAETTLKAGNMIVGNEEGVEGAKLYSEVIPVASYSAYGVSAQAESAVTVTVTNIQPSYAVDQTIAWSMSFGEDVVENWATGNERKAENYVKITPSADTHAVVVECLKAFGAPVIVSGEFSTGVKVSFTCDYLQKVSDIALKLYVSGAGGATTGEVTGSISFLNDSFAATTSYRPSVTCTYGVGTLQPVFVQSEKVKIGFGSTVQGYLAVDMRSSYHDIEVYYVSSDVQQLRSLFVEGTSAYNNYEQTLVDWINNQETAGVPVESRNKFLFVEAGYTVTYNGEETDSGKVKREFMISLPFAVESANVSTDNVIFR